MQRPDKVCSKQTGFVTPLAGALTQPLLSGQLYSISQLTCITFCYICYTIRDFSPTRPKVAPLSQSDRRIIAPLQHLFLTAVGMY